jgi:TolB protein
MTTPGEEGEMARVRLNSTRCLGAAAALVAVAALGVAATGAWATAPGKNGKLAFRRYLDEAHTQGSLFTANPDGSMLRQITHAAKGVLDIEPDWSPDGTKIVFQRIRLNGCGEGCEADEIDVVGSDGSGLTRLVYDPASTGCARNGRLCRGVPAWSPDGSEIAFACGSRICVTAADGSSVRPLPQTPATGVSDTAPAWSPDGSEIAFGRSVGYKRGIFVMNADGSDPRQVTPWALRAGQPDWSPDGTRIVFYSNWDGPSGVSANLYTIDPEGTALTQLTHAGGGTVQYLSATFSPDGKWITFSRRPATGSEGNADVFVMRADGTYVRNVTRSAIWDSGTDWGPQGS